jgi:hypothetical protein
MQDTQKRPVGRPKGIPNPNTGRPKGTSKPNGQTEHMHFRVTPEEKAKAAKSGLTQREIFLIGLNSLK